MLADMPHSSSLLLASLQRRVPKQTFDTWFKPLTVEACTTQRVVTFSAPNTIVKEWVVAHYARLIEESLRELSLEQYKVEWSLSQSSTASALNPDQAPQKRDVRGDRNTEERPRAEEDVIPFIEAIPSSLNEKYTFPHFVVASCNRFAHAAAKAVSEAPGQT